MLHDSVQFFNLLSFIFRKNGLQSPRHSLGNLGLDNKHIRSG